MADPFSLDFSALRCLRMVHAHGSFSRAAESLGVGQSSVSYTIARLREVFCDPLFVRQGGGIMPTERCVEIVERTGWMVDEFEALAAPRAFDPGTAELSIGLSCNFYERVTILPGLTRILRSVQKLHWRQASLLLLPVARLRNVSQVHPPRRYRDTVRGRAPINAAKPQLGRYRHINA